MRIEVGEVLRANVYKEDRGYGYILNLRSGGYVDSAGGFQDFQEAKNAAIHMAEFFERHPEGFLEGESCVEREDENED